MFWNQQVETLSRADMTIWQSHKLHKMLERVYDKNSLYNERMMACGLKPEDVMTVENLVKLPFTMRQDLINNYPYGLLTMPISGVSYIHRQQEKNNGPTAVSYTKSDMVMWMELMSRILVAGGLNTTSVFQSVVNGALYPSSAAIQLGARQVGAAIVSAESEHAKQQLVLMQDFGVTSIFAMPEFLLVLAEEMQQVDNNDAKLPLQNIFCEMQAVTDCQSRQIKEAYGIQPLKIYGLDEIFGMAIGGECHCANGIHIQEDCFYPEIIQPVSQQVMAVGESGELVLTSLALEAMPLLRYRTGVHGWLDDRQCICGRTLVRFKQGEAE